MKFVIEHASHTDKPWPTAKARRLITQDGQDQTIYTISVSSLLALTELVEQSGGRILIQRTYTRPRYEQDAPLPPQTLIIDNEALFRA